MADDVAADVPAEESSELAAGDGLVISDAHQNQRFAGGEHIALLCCPRCGPDRIGKTFPGAQVPPAGDVDELVRTTTQLAANVIDDQLDTAPLPTTRASVSRLTGSREAR